MSPHDPFAIPTSPRPIAVGTGLVALDVVVTEGDDIVPREWLGGSCGNVLAALAYLGWQSKPVARLGIGTATDRVVAEMLHCKISSEFVTFSEDGSTPIIIERVSRDASGRPRHSFTWRCPACGRPFPGYKPVLASAVADIAERLNSVQVFFFDRVSAAAVQLADECSSRGALVVFEPSGVGNPLQFRQALRHAHIVKYSHERLSDLAEFEVPDGPWLQVETLGEAGLRYRARTPKCGGPWVELPPLPVNDLRDAAGAGDWCTAGIIHYLGQTGAAGLRGASPRTVEEGLRFGQALAAWNCGFEGARGGMYVATRASFRRAVKRLLAGKDLRTVSHVQAQAAVKVAGATVCGFCGDPSATCGVRRPG